MNNTVNINPYDDLEKQSDGYPHITFKGTKDIGVFTVFIDDVKVRGLTAASITVDNKIGRSITLTLSVPLRNLHFE